MALPRRRRWPWVLGAALLALPVLGVLALRLLLDPEALRARLVAAAEAATGRAVTVEEVRLALSLHPAVELRGVALANPPGFSRPRLLEARRVEVQAALLPLLSRRVELTRVVVEGADLLLEVDAAGRPNWAFTPAAPASPAPAPAAPAPAAPARPLAVEVASLRIADSRLGWRDARSGRAEALGLAMLEGAAPAAGPATLRARLERGGEALALEAEGGPPGALRAALAGGAPWPLRARLAGLEGEATAEGTLGPGQAWQARLALALPDPARLAPLLPDLPIPPLRDVAARASLAGSGAALARAEGIALRLGAADLGMLRQGFALASAEATADGLDAPLTLAAEGVAGPLPWRLAGSAGTPALWLGRAAGPLALDLGWTAGGPAAGTQASLRGTIAEPRALAGVDLALGLAVPDAAALAPLAGRPLPPLRDLAAQARLAERTPGFAGGAHLRELRVTSSAGDLSGELTLVVGERPGLVGRLASARLDLDALRARGVAATAAPGGAATAAPGGSAAAAPGGPPAGAAGPPRLIPDLPLPVAALRAADADLTLTLAELRAAGAEWRAVGGRLRLDAGRARLAPFSAEAPFGPVSGEAEADATADPPALRLVLRAPALELGAAQALAGLPPRLSGRAELEADLRGAGATTRALAATLSGHLGLAMVDGVAEPALLRPLGGALRAALPVPLPVPERLPLDCVALRAEAQGGVARIQPLLLDAPLGKVAGSGTLDLGREVLALELQHDVRTREAVLRIAAELAGPLAAPALRGVQLRNAGELVGGLAGRLGGDAGALLGALANRPGARAEPLPDCAAALAAARGGRAGPLPAARPPAPAAPTAEAPAAPAVPGLPPQLQGPAGQLLRGLLGR